MARDLPEFYTVEQAARRALRTTATIRRWIMAGFLKIVEGGYFKHSRRRYLILGTDLDEAIARVNMMASIPKGEKRVYRERPSTWARYRAHMTDEQYQERLKQQAEYKRKWRKAKQRLNAKERSLGLKPDGRSSRAHRTKDPSLLAGMERLRRRRLRLRRGGTFTLLHCLRQFQGSSAASPSTSTRSMAAKRH